MPISLAGSARPVNISAPVAQHSQPITHNSHTLRLLTPQGKAHGLLCRAKQGALTLARHLARALCQRHGDEFAPPPHLSRPVAPKPAERNPTPITSPVISSPRQVQLQSTHPAMPNQTPVAGSADPTPLPTVSKPIVPPKPKNIPPPRNTLAQIVTTAATTLQNAIPLPIAATAVPVMQSFAPVPPAPPPPPLNWMQQPLTAPATTSAIAAKAPPKAPAAPRPNQSVVNEINVEILKKFAALHAENDDDDDDDDDVSTPDDDVGDIEVVVAERHPQPTQVAMQVAMPDLTQHPMLKS